ncbi:MAG TPA: tRNA preQ1(34) S-adenosylmethionine ribosyltransferase-isomerase QueA [Acidobacteriaceae bacterium]|jgi:S-adenosylmethionine:tRNA ribosyltransferase-isomerase|nr:tRNA preQ1(34) S-adenosylmethionine ribosyltransferase-isomerase QueA [Acidobacteriaceae bacterium]
MLVSDFDFHLPEATIAQEPLADRAASRMLALDRATGAFQDRWFRELPELLQAGDLLVLNDSRVIPARLFAHRVGLHPQEGHRTTGRVQVLLVEQFDEWEWKALVRPGRKVLTGERLDFLPQDAKPGRRPEEAELRAEVIARGEFGERTLRFEPVVNFFAAVEQLGHMPLPPYIHREDRAGDRERYQTVYARERGSVAAPTAGLHFTPEILEAVRARGVEITRVTLHVGLGTFQPVRVERVEDVRLHAERYTISPETAAALNAARREGRRIVAAGTTTVRTLEHCALSASEFVPHSGSTTIFIAPGFEFRIVGALLTNFHLPQSTLLMLVSAFAGRERVLAAYRHAVEAGYRFFSYGDCMLIA